MALKTNYVDSQYTQKRYTTTTSGGNIIFTDATDYSVEGDFIGCEDINLQNLEYNSLVNKFTQIDALIAALQSYGVTVSGNSPNDIENALNTLASNKRSAGNSAGVAAVRNNPTAYGVYDPKGLYDTEAVYRNKINTAINALSPIGLPSIPGVPSIAIMWEHDPIHSKEARETREAINGAADEQRSGAASFSSSAASKMNSAISALA